MRIAPKHWNDIEDAPRDGTPILACRDTGCGWEHMVVWWNGTVTYPWRGAATSYTEDRLDYWQELTVPRKS